MLDCAQLLIPGDLETTYRAGCRHFVDVCKEAIFRRGAFFVALSGGSTPKALYTLLTKPPYREQIEWGKVWLFWSDERSGPPTDPESNYNMALLSGFSKVAIPEGQIHRMEATGDLPKNALAYEEKIRSLLYGQPFDLVMLGMGEDGHVASLFPGTEALLVKDHLVAANFVPQKNSMRMTLTFSCINEARVIVVYILGDSKKERVYDALMHPEKDYPIQHVGTPSHPALWILDEKAAALLK